MLSRIQRVSTKQFEEIMKKGRVVHSPLFIARIVPLENAEPSKFAAVAPAKIAKTAVIRNRTRRVIYESIRSFLSDIKDGNIVAVFAKPPLLTAGSKEIRVGLKELFVKAGLLL